MFALVNQPHEVVASLSLGHSPLKTFKTFKRVNMKLLNDGLEAGVVRPAHRNWVDHTHKHTHKHTNTHTHMYVHTKTHTHTHTHNTPPAPQTGVDHHSGAVWKRGL